MLGKITVKTKNKHLCYLCRRIIPIGDKAKLKKIYHKYDGFCVERRYFHFKCSYKDEARINRPCPHPAKMVFTVYSYIPGECVQEPHHDECGCCGKWL